MCCFTKLFSIWTKIIIIIIIIMSLKGLSNNMNQAICSRGQTSVTNFMTQKNICYEGTSIRGSSIKDIHKNLIIF